MYSVLNHFSNKFVSIAILVCGVTLVGCVTTPQATYVSSTVYKDYSCTQLEREYKRVNTAVANHKNQSFFDTTGMNIGIHAGRGGIFPSVSVGMNSRNSAGDYGLSRLLGERNAITEASLFAGCDFPITHKVAKK